MTSSVVRSRKIGYEPEPNDTPHDRETAPDDAAWHTLAVDEAAKIGWGLGVWLGLLGSVLLLMRSRYAVHAFALSLLGMVLSLGGQYLGPPAPAEMVEGMKKYFPLLILVLGLAQLWYAWRERGDGVLR